MIQRRWRQRQSSNESGSHDGSHDDYDLSTAENSSKKRLKRLQRSDSNDDRGDDSTTTTSSSNDTNSSTAADLSLLFRRNSNSSSISTMISPRHYSQLQFLSASGGSDVILIAVDNYGDLDIIRSSRCGEGSTRGSTLQADRMSIFASPSSSSFAVQNNHHENENVMAGVEGPRQPMNNNFHYEIYSYDSGNKLAIGLRGGRVQLFGSTERAAAAKRNNSSSSMDARGARLLWSCLPSTSVTIGPQRRYRCNDQYPLSRILSSSNNNNNNTTTTTASISIRERENVLDAYNTFIFEEISDWDRVDDDYYFTLRRRGGSGGSAAAALNRMILGDGCPWAFREGSSNGGNGGNGMSGTALIGACVDIDNGDCFSLRVIDERCCFTSSPASSSCCNSTMNVIVVDDYPSKQGGNGGSSRVNERVDSVCFSGEFGLVTSHSITNAVGDNQELTATSIKVRSVVSLEIRQKLFTFFSLDCFVMKRKRMLVLFLLVSLFRYLFTPFYTPAILYISGGIIECSVVKSLSLLYVYHSQEIMLVYSLQRGRCTLMVPPLTTTLILRSLLLLHHYAN